MIQLLNTSTCLAHPPLIQLKNKNTIILFIATDQIMLRKEEANLREDVML